MFRYYLKLSDCSCNSGGEKRLVKTWIEMCKSGFRIVFVGIFSLLLAFMIYARLTAPTAEHLVMLTPQLRRLAIDIFAITFASMVLVTCGIYKIFKAEHLRTANSNSLLSYITNTFSDNKFWKVMVIAAIAYSIFFVL
jgi:hypothetical protein